MKTAVEAGRAPRTAGLLAAGGSALGVLARLGLGVVADRRDGRWFLVIAAMMLAGAPGRATGVTQSGVAVGGALGPLGFGLLADAVSLSAAWSATAVLAVLAAGAVVGGRRLLLRDRPALAMALRKS